MNKSCTLYKVKVRLYFLVPILKFAFRNLGPRLVNTFISSQSNYNSVLGACMQVDMRNF